MSGETKLPKKVFLIMVAVIVLISTWFFAHNSIISF